MDFKSAIAKWFNDLMDSMIFGSIPERKVCDCDEMECFCDDLHKLEMWGHL